MKFRFIHAALAATIVFSVLPAGLPPLAAQSLFQDDPLIVAAFKNKINDVRALLVRGHQTDRRDREGRTALIWGATQGNYEVVQLLLDGRSLIDGVDSYGNTALYYAAGNGHVDTIELLLEYGAAVDGANLEGRTPLMRAVEASHVEAAETLIDGGADVNRTDFTGRTVLDWSREGRSNRLTRLLQKAGAR